MARLTKGMYGERFYAGAGPFGLHSGQMSGRKTRLAKNSGWYNKLGERLTGGEGYSGDLSVDDFRRIAKEIAKGELFIVLSESDSHWNLTRRFGEKGSWMMRKKKPRADAPGVEYVAEHAMYVIARGQLYLVDRHNDLRRRTKMFRGLRFKVLRGDEVKALMMAKAAP